MEQRMPTFPIWLYDPNADFRNVRIALPWMRGLLIHILKRGMGPNFDRNGLKGYTGPPLGWRCYRFVLLWKCQVWLSLCGLSCFIIIDGTSLVQVNVKVVVNVLLKGPWWEFRGKFCCHGHWTHHCSHEIWRGHQIRDLFPIFREGSEIEVLGWQRGEYCSCCFLDLRDLNRRENNLLFDAWLIILLLQAHVLISPI